jgi:hypothetical protein
LVGHSRASVIEGYMHKIDSALLAAAIGSRVISMTP